LLILVTHCKFGPDSFLKFKALGCFELLMRPFIFVSSFIFLDLQIAKKHSGQFDKVLPMYEELERRY
jgi:hypothetical protein